MHNLLRIFSVAMLIAVVVSCASYSPIGETEERFTRAQVAEDLDAFVSFVLKTHPDIEHSAERAQLERGVEDIGKSLEADMTMRQAWASFAALNPIFKDAHVGVRRPIEAIAQYEENGGELFPGQVLVGASGAVRFVGEGLADLGIANGDEIISINGIPASDIVSAIKPLMRGNSEALALLIMERYFPQYFWVIFGEFDQYVVSVKSEQGIRTIELPFSEPASNNGQTEPFIFKALNEHVAYMEVTTFDISEKDNFQTFVEGAFEQIASRKMDTLVIDLRKNGGGAHDVSDLLMAYLTDEPYSAISGITARVTQENIDRLPDATLGSVVSVPFQQRIEPQKTLPHRFGGKVYVLVGGLTYSQAIAFSSTVQDYNLATIVGEETEGPANQTGQLQWLKLPNTGFEVFAPIYIFTRASGDTSNRGVVPDIEIKNNPLEPEASVRRLLEIIEN